MRNPLLYWVVLATGLASGADDLFTTTVWPALKKDCLGCHGEGQMLSKLDLRTREAMLRGGSRGPAVQPGNSAASLLHQAVKGGGSLEMPPGGASKRLPPEAIAAIAKWIDAGAPWTAAEVSGDRWGSFKEADLWAFRPVRARDRSRGIDSYIDERIRAAGFTAAPPSDRHALLRRVTIDLTGLPPTPEEHDAFANDRSRDAWSKVVERLLASPRYGERQARHWLDVVRYADTNGYSNDFERPNAWRYRDYVIRAFQNDKPFDRFVREQIAGDELYPGDGEAMIATGFLRSGPWEHTGMSVEAVTRQMFLDDVTGATGAVFLGLTTGCARCHDHKFDPIPTRDYYRLQAVFATTEFARPSVAFLPSENTRDLDEGKAAFGRVMERTQASLKSFDGKVTESLMKKHGVSKPADLPPGALKKALQLKSELTAEEFEHMKLYQKHMQLHRESIVRYDPKAFAVSSGPADGATDGGPNLQYPKRASYKAPDTHILTGGNVQSPAGKVEPGALSLLARYGDYPEPAIPDAVAGRRAALAEWIAGARNPLTARVIANRIWQQHFGAGIAGDPNNFGKMGKKPTHPELLDWLAAYLVEKNWSIKELHRAILMSAAYQRSSAHPDVAKLRDKDPANALLTHYSPRRVEAEVVRDGMLAVAGELSPDAGGPGVYPRINEDVARQPLHRMGSLSPAYEPSPKKRQRNRRTIYTFQQRSLADPMVEVFNGASMDLSCERRDAATIPTQAFALFNGEFPRDIALALAARADREAKGAARIDRLFRLTFGRAPDAQERRLVAAHLAKATAEHRAHPPAPRPQPKPLVHRITSELTGQQHDFAHPPSLEPYEHDLHPSEVSADVRGLAEVALVLLNSNEFVYIY